MFDIVGVISFTDVLSRASECMTDLHLDTDRTSIQPELHRSAMQHFSCHLLRSSPIQRTGNTCTVVENSIEFSKNAVIFVD